MDDIVFIDQANISEPDAPIPAVPDTVASVQYESDPDEVAS